MVRGVDEQSLRYLFLSWLIRTGLHNVQEKPRWSETPVMLRVFLGRVIFPLPLCVGGIGLVEGTIPGPTLRAAPLPCHLDGERPLSHLFTADVLALTCPGNCQLDVVGQEGG